jgi:glucose/mannose transport system substrate-binding protein
VTRRRFVETAGLGATAALAGCVDEANDLVAGSTRPLEVLHGWDEGDGAVAVRALTDAFEEHAPAVETDFTAIEGGGNENLNTVVSYRLADGDPPSSFANWPGKNLRRYEGALGSIDDVWAENDFAAVHVDEAVDLHHQNGSFRAVPLGSHRLNNLFYNVELLEEAGVDPTGITSLGALFDAMDAVAAETDATPMTHAMANPWPTTQLWAAVLLGQQGYRAYVDFIERNGSEAAVRSAFETTARILEDYVTYDAESLGLTASNNNVINGDAAFVHQGNWTAGTFATASDFEYGDGWGANAFPGTENMYTLHFDSFLYPGDNPTPERSKRWLAFVGSETAQVAFNRHKGSIPTRTDVDMSEFNEYLQSVAEDFENAEHRPPTLQHGLALAPEKVTALNRVVANTFMGPYDVDAATSGFLDVV